MIDRYTFVQDREKLKYSFDYLQEVPEITPAYNAAPASRQPVTTMDQPGTVRFFQWGFISVLSNNKKMSPRLFNTDIISGLSKPSIKKNLILKKCLIYATGLFLWRLVGKKTLTPYYLHPADDRIFTIGGFWEERDEFVEDSQDSFMMLTRPAEPDLSPYQEDMPLIIPAGREIQWLNADFDPTEALIWADAPSGISWIIYPVSPAITRLDRNDPQLIQRTPPADQHGNYTLFG